MKKAVILFVCIMTLSAAAQAAQICGTLQGEPAQSAEQASLTGLQIQPVDGSAAIPLAIQGDLQKVLSQVGSTTCLPGYYTDSAYVVTESDMEQTESEGYFPPRCGIAPLPPCAPQCNPRIHPCYMN